MRMRWGLSASLIAAALSASARAALPLLYTNTSNLLPDTPNQVLQIYVAGTDVIQGENLNFQINGGESGPFFTGVDIITGTIFAGSTQGYPNDTANFNSQGIYITGTLSGHLAVVLTTTIGNAVTTDNGLLATLLITTTTSSGATFVLNMIDTVNRASNFGTGGSGKLALTYPNNQLSIGTADRQWKTDGGGTWATDSNWTPFAPYARGDIANFLGVLTSGIAVVTLDGPRTVGTIRFNNTAGSYDLQPGSGGSLRLDIGTQAALLDCQAGRHSISAPIALVANTNVSVSPGGTLTLSGGISGTSSALALTGGGLLILTGANSYGATSIAAGSTLQVGNGTAGGSLGTAAVTNGGLLNLAALALPVAVPMGGSGTVTISGFVTLTNTSTADTMIITSNGTSSGTLQVGNGGTSGALAGTSVINNGQLTFSRSDAAVQDALITGAGTLTQLGTGTTTLTSAANYNGPTSILAGVLAFGGGATDSIADVSGTGTMLVAASTILTSDGVNMPAGTLTVNGTHTIRSNPGNAAYPDTNPTTARPGTTKVASLTSVGASGTLDLKNNGLIVESADTASKATLLAQLGQQMQTAGLYTTLPNITSSTAVTNPNYRLALVDNANLNAIRIGGSTSFGGLPMDNNSILVTQAGIADANLDGSVDAIDFNAWLHGSTAYSQAGGDFNGDGFVDAIDFNLWLHASAPGIAPSMAGGGLSGPAPGPELSGGTGAVPEPASLCLLGLGAVGVLFRRRRQQARVLAGGPTTPEKHPITLPQPPAQKRTSCGLYALNRPVLEAY